MQNRSIEKLSTAHYNVLKKTKDFSLLEVNLMIGRKNQIRVHLAEKGHPVVGDTKYGQENNPHKRLALHAYSILFLHPYSGKRMFFKTKIPPFFTNLVGNLWREFK